MRNAGSIWWTTSSYSKTSVFSVFQNLHSEECFWKDASSVTVFTGYVWTVLQTVEKKNLRFQIRKDTCGRGPAVCQLKSEWFPRYLLIPRKKIHNFFHHTSQESNWTQHFRIDHNVLCHSLPPKILQNHWDDCNIQEKLETKVMPNLGG